MYKDYFGLKELPFSIAPDPHYLYMSDTHREALAHLLYGINSDNGFVLLTGDVGTGKTTVCRCLLEQLPENSNIAFIINPKLSVKELLATICDELGIQYPEGNISNKVFIDNINHYLLEANAKGRRTVLILEEAQNLSPYVLEQIRLLTNLETNQRKLLQIIMIGQPELSEMLSRPELRQLKQRITARYHLGPLTRQEVASYVGYRLSKAGGERTIFPSSTLDRLFRLSKGIPRMINLLCDRALLGTYVQGRDMVDAATMNRAAGEVFGETVKSEKRKTGWALAVLIIIAGLVAGASAYYNFRAKTEEIKPTASLTLNSPQLPAGLPFENSEGFAYSALFRKWGITKQYQEDIPPCQQAASFGLECLKGIDNLNNLIKLNRPAVLKLHDDQGREFYVALTELRQEQATVESGHETRTVDVKEIEKRWRGDYVLLWEVPPGYRGDIFPGSRGVAIDWLDLQLAAIQGRKASVKKKSLYDPNLVGQVKNYQLSEGLMPDGTVGPLTVIHLNNAAGSRAPKLLQKQGES
ncbi:MAG: AAA family ATPase [Nitrospirota bacterium]|nr:AAA family ATPase [Nitrospirota bacterium]